MHGRVCARTRLSWAARPSAVWFGELLKHLRAGLLFYKEKKQTVECGADSQKVMWRLKGGGGGGGGSMGGGGAGGLKNTGPYRNHTWLLT